MLINKLESVLKKLSLPFRRNDSTEHLEPVIYQSFCIISIIAGIVSAFINFFTDMHVVVYMSITLIIFQSYCWYLCKIKGKLNLAITISSIGFHLVLAFNYFYNAGISGPTLMLTALTLFFIAIVDKKSNVVLWLCVNVLTTSVLLGIEYFNPESILAKYNTRQNLFMDMYFTYLIVIVVIFQCVLLLRKRHKEQQDHITQKALALEKLNAEKIKLFSLISHDLRTPLANVQQYLEMMAQVDLTIDEKKVIEKDLLHITKNAQKLLGNLLQWSSNQMEGVDVNLQSYALLDEIDKTLANMKLLAAKKEIKLVVKIKDKCAVIADLDMLNLIVRNLIHNAIKFTPFGGTIEIGANTKGNECVIYVKDNGVGIPINQQSELFNLRTKASFGTNKEKGTGIGLMLCKEYAEMQNGRVWFKSKEGMGTIFYLALKTDI